MKLFNWFKKTDAGAFKTQENTMKASIGFDNTSGKYTLSAGGATVGSYARARDARRGAARRGLTLIEA